MKKLILFLSLVVLIPFSLSALPMRYIDVVEKQTKFYPELTSSWIKTNTTSIYLNLNDNILIFEKNKLKLYDIITIKLSEFDASNVYDIIAKDEDEVLYNIQVCELGESLLVTVYNDNEILRYRTK